MFYRALLVLFLLAIVWSVLVLLASSDYTFRNFSYLFVIQRVWRYQRGNENP